MRGYRFSFFVVMLSSLFGFEYDCVDQVVDVGFQVENHVWRAELSKNLFDKFIIVVMYQPDRFNDRRAGILEYAEWQPAGNNGAQLFGVVVVGSLHVNGCFKRAGYGYHPFVEFCVVLFFHVSLTFFDFL